MSSEPVPTDPAPEPVVAPSAPPPAATVIRVTPAWWVPIHAFAVLAARLAYPLALLAVAGWLVSVVIRADASGWFVLAILILVCALIAAAPRDPEA